MCVLTWKSTQFMFFSTGEDFRFLTFKDAEIFKTLQSGIFTFFFTLHFFDCFPCSVVDDVQVSCYRILNSLYFLGTNKSIYVERYGIPEGQLSFFHITVFCPQQ